MITHPLHLINPKTTMLQDVKKAQNGRSGEKNAHFLLLFRVGGSSRSR